jgi:hypothetical protein
MPRCFASDIQRQLPRDAHQFKCFSTGSIASVPFTFHRELISERWGATERSLGLCADRLRSLAPVHLLTAEALDARSDRIGTESAITAKRMYSMVFTF